MEKFGRLGIVTLKGRSNSSTKRIPSLKHGVTVGSLLLRRCISKKAVRHCKLLPPRY